MRLVAGAGRERAALVPVGLLRLLLRLLLLLLLLRGEFGRPPHAVLVVSAVVMGDERRLAARARDIVGPLGITPAVGGNVRGEGEADEARR